MTTDLLNLAVPGLGSAIKLLYQLYNKYDRVKKGRELCTNLHRRLEAFAQLLNDIAPDVRQQEALLPRLQQLLEEFVATVTIFAQQNFVRQLRRQTHFEEDIKVFNERLDDVIKMLTVAHAEVLAAAGLEDALRAALECIAAAIGLLYCTTTCIITCQR